MAQEKEHSNNLSQKKNPMWDLADPKHSLLNIREYFELLHISNGAPCSYMIWKNIIPLKYISNVGALHGEPDAQMIVTCPIIPINQHHWCYGGVDAEVLNELDDLPAPKYVLNLAMCYSEPKVVVARTLS